MRLFFSKLPRWARVLGLALIVLGGYFFFRRGEVASGGTTFVARRGPLEITVLEGGSLEAMESQDVKCEVRGYQGVKILKIVEEGYLVSESDIKTNRVLVELDSSELRKQITQQDISLESSLAALVDARQSYDIQLNQNFSDIKAAEQKAKFALMDLEKFLGDQAAKGIVEELGLLEESQSSVTNKVENVGAPAVAASPSRAAEAVAGTNGTLGAPLAGSPSAALKLTNAFAELPLVVLSEPTNSPVVPKPPVPPETAKPNPARKASLDFSKYARIELLGDGEAKQKIRKFDDDLQVAQHEMGVAKSILEGTQRLLAKDFVTKTELESDEIKMENSRLKVQTAETARALFRKYEFPKTAEETLSKYAEATRELGRARKGAVSKLAQAEAKVKGAEGRYNLETKQRQDIIEQVEKCTIRAQKTGLVVYGGGNNNRYYYGEEQIREGALVREQQPIITIPDMTKMSAKVRIHETYIKKIKKGQAVRIKVDAFPDKQLEGEVSKVGVLPDSQNRWMNPDLKVYLTTITVTGVHDWLKPGMSAKVEIMIKELPDVVYVPIQAVSPAEGKQFCFVGNGLRPERREVEIGEFNDEFIEIKSGLKEGERVALRVPAGTEKEQEGKKPGVEDKPKPQPPAEPARAGRS